MRTPSSQKCRLDLAPPWADRFILGITPSIAARYFSAGPADSTSRWTPCPPKYSKRWLQVGLGCVQLSPSCPFRPLHPFRFLRPARLRTPLLGYGAPHLSARGTSTLLNNTLLSAHFRGPTIHSQSLLWQPASRDHLLAGQPWSFVTVWETVTKLDARVQLIAGATSGLTTIGEYIRYRPSARCCLGISSMRQ